MEITMQLYSLNEDLTIYDRSTTLKERAANYLGMNAGDPLSKKEIRRLQGKANKMKKSGVKAQRNRDLALKHLKIDEPGNS
jgi:hypothetical protein